MNKKFFAYILLFFAAFMLIACNDDNNDHTHEYVNGECECGEKEPNNNNTVTTKSIEIVEESVPEFVILSELDSTLNNIELLVKKSDNTSQKVNVNKDMISDTDLNKLNELGDQTVKVNYDNFSTELELYVVNYAVKVVYPDNTPAGKGILVQWCIGEICLTPVATNANGVAGYDIDEDNYYIHIENIPAGYTYDPNAYVSTPNNKVIEIKLIKQVTVSAGNGTNETPYLVGCGAYNLSFEKTGVSGCQYFGFTAEENGNYTIESIATVALAKNFIDPYFGYFGTTIGELADADVSGNPSDNLNFNFTFEAEAGKTYYFIVFVSNNSNTRLPANFEINIAKK